MADPTTSARLEIATPQKLGAMPTVAGRNESAFTMRCWADVLGDCAGSITKEHLVTEALFGRRITVESGSADTQPVASEIPTRKLTANILCRRHNQLLGMTADAAAKRLLSALRVAKEPMALPGSRILRPPRPRLISGVNFGRWVCKTHCNFRAASGRTPHISYVCYACGRPTPTPIHFYMRAQVGDRMKLGEPSVRWRELVHDDDPTFDACELTLSGFATVLSTESMQLNHRDMIDRVAVLRSPTPLGTYDIIFDWSGEPAVQPEETKA